MSQNALIKMEIMKLKRSKIILLFILATAIVWIPSVLNADMNFQMQVEGISPEHNFLIQGFLAFSWFMYPAIVVVCTVMLNQIEWKNRGMQKMYTLPISSSRLCIGKLMILFMLTLFEVILFMVGYYTCAALATHLYNYDFLLPLQVALKEAAFFYLSSIPLVTVFWMLAVIFKNPVPSVGVGLFSIIPSVLIINTKYWLAYPVCYPFYVMTSQYADMADGIRKLSVNIPLFIVVSIVFSLICIGFSCNRYRCKSVA